MFPNPNFPHVFWRLHTFPLVLFTNLVINHVHQIFKKIVFLPCCELVLFCAFGAQNRVQFAWAKILLHAHHQARWVMLCCGLYYSKPHP